MEPIWLQHYEEGQPQTIEIDPNATFLDIFHTSCESHRSRIAYSSFGTTMTYQEVADLSKAFAAYLQHAVGVQKGDRVALICPNHMCFPIAMFGILQAGAVQVNVNPLYTPKELAHQLKDAQVDVVIFSSVVMQALAEIREQLTLKKLISIDLDDLIGKGLPSTPVDERLHDAESFIKALDTGKTLEFSPPSMTGEDLMFLQYTGGTTGLSKGAMLSHGNIVANIAQFEGFIRSSLPTAENVIVTAIPMYHIFALTVNTLGFFKFGALNVMITNPRDMPGFVTEWSKWKVNAFTGVNTLFNGLLHTPGFAELDFSDLRICIGGGAPVQEAVSNRWKDATGRHIKEGYGLSETSPVLTLNPMSQVDFKNSIGIPIPSTEISLRDEEGSEVPMGSSGELCVRGPQVMKGYWERPEATAEVMTEDGFFRTGDVAILREDGFFQIVDRKKDMILVSGFNVYPNEIEHVVAHMEQVLECACIGVPDTQTGESVRLFVVKKDEELTEEDVIAYCRQQLTGYKVPKQIYFIEALPKSTVGKILRRELRNWKV